MFPSRYKEDVIEHKENPAIELVTVCTFDFGPSRIEVEQTSKDCQKHYLQAAISPKRDEQLTTHFQSLRVVIICYATDNYGDENFQAITSIMMGLVKDADLSSSGSVGPVVEYS